jgi:hypothetical protein
MLMKTPTDQKDQETNLEIMTMLALVRMEMKNQMISIKEIIILIPIE